MDITKRPMQIERDPTSQPGKDAGRMEWMAWEQLWKQAAKDVDAGLLAKLIGNGVDTPEKRVGAALVFEYWVGYPSKYEGKLMRLLMRGGAPVPPLYIAPLCVCGERAVLLMQKHGVDLTSTNLMKENGLALACLINNDKEFEKVWRILRGAGLDPTAMDDTLECAFDAADTYGKMALVERIEAQMVSESQAKALNKATASNKPGRKGGGRL